MQIPDTLKNEVIGIEAVLKTQKARLAQTRRNGTKAKTEATRLYATLNFRERYLNGWFGGDQGSIARYKRQRSLTAKFNQKAEQLEGKTIKLNKDLWGTIAFHLQENDPQYQSWDNAHKAGLKLVKTLDSFQDKIQTALDKIGQVRTVEFFDLFTKNTGIAMASYLKNMSAAKAVRAVEKATPGLERAVKNYGGVLQESGIPKPESKIRDGMDLVFDLAFDGVDVLSVFTLSALGKSQSAMKDVLETVQDIGEHVNRNLDKTEKATIVYMKHCRKLCLQ